MSTPNEYGRSSTRVAVIAHKLHMNRTGVTFKEIQEMFDVSLRTAQRYAKVLREASEANMPTIAVAAQVRGEYGLALNPAWRYYQN